jgi:RNA-directed DNA polymerase
MGLFDLLRRVWGAGGSPDSSPVEPPSSLAGRDLSSSSYSDTSNSLAHSRQVPRPLQGLELGRFEPLSEHEAMRVTQTADWRSASLDSRASIPPAILPRIQVIDRTMVGLGLITPDELVAIHTVGLQMDQFVNQHVFAAATAEQAVATDRAQRAQQKAEKKLAAEQRRAERQASISLRRQTDIIYLGRGVSRGLANQQAQVERLVAQSLPVLATPLQLANAMGLTVSRLRWLAFHNPAATRTHYTNFVVPKKSGGQRKLSAPHRQLAAAQHWILANILQKLPVHEAAHGFVLGRSTVTNATPHVGSCVVVNADLQDFFPTITFARVDGLFRSIGFSPAVATILSLLCTESPREVVRLSGTIYHAATGPRVLPQGACTSPMISNLIVRGLDRRFTKLSEKLGWRYTRYADDLTFSCLAEPNPSLGYLLARIRHICEDEGFAVNEAKTRILRRSRRQEVTGIVVNDQAGVPRPTVRRLRAILHQARNSGLAAQNRDAHPDFRAYVAGMIAYIEMVNPRQGGRLRHELESLPA